MVQQCNWKYPSSVLNVFVLYLSLGVVVLCITLYQCTSNGFRDQSSLVYLLLAEKWGFQWLRNHLARSLFTSVVWSVLAFGRKPCVGLLWFSIRILIAVTSEQKWLFCVCEDFFRLPFMRPEPLELANSSGLWPANIINQAFECSCVYIF